MFLASHVYTPRSYSCSAGMTSKLPCISISLGVKGRKKYSLTCSKDHLYIDHILQVSRCILSMLLNLIPPKDHLCIRTTFFWSLGWSLYTSFTVYKFARQTENLCLVCFCVTVYFNFQSMWAAKYNWNNSTYHCNLKSISGECPHFKVPSHCCNLSCNVVASRGHSGIAYSWPGVVLR